MTRPLQSLRTSRDVAYHSADLRVCGRVGGPMASAQKTEEGMDCRGTDARRFRCAMLRERLLALSCRIATVKSRAATVAEMHHRLRELLIMRNSRAMLW